MNVLMFTLSNARCVTRGFSHYKTKFSTMTVPLLLRDRKISLQFVGEQMCKNKTTNRSTLENC